MAKDAKQIVFGVHGVTVMDYFTGLPIAELDVIGDLSLPVTAEVEDLYGGFHNVAVAGEPKTLTIDGTLELREFPEDVVDYLVAATGAKTAAESTGSVTTLASYNGGLVATTGVASVGLKSGKTTELKAGLYIVSAVDATTVDVYATSTADLKKGTDITPINDSLKITTTPLTITTSTAVEVPNLGVELTGGSGTIGMTAGDTAFFEIKPPHAGTEVVTIGTDTDEFKRVALVATAQKRTTGEIAYVFMPNALALGLPLAMPEKGWASGSVTIKVYSHPTLGFAMRFTSIKGTSV